MVADNAPRDLEERNSERMNFRTKPRIRQAIQHAAALSGMDDSAFALDAAYRAALDVIERHERTKLKPEDYEAFFSALDRPPEPNARLRAAFERHRRTVTSR